MNPAMVRMQLITSLKDSLRCSEKCSALDEARYEKVNLPPVWEIEVSHHDLKEGVGPPEPKYKHRINLFLWLAKYLLLVSLLCFISQFWTFSSFSITGFARKKNLHSESGESTVEVSQSNGIQAASPCKSSLYALY